jgi:archaellum biogenesis ATPase FlaH
MLTQLLGETQPKPGKAQQQTSIAGFPLTCCLAPATRDFINGGVGEGLRNKTGAAVARDLIGVATHLDRQGIAYDGDPQALFEQFCHRCSPPIGDREAATIWRSAQKVEPAPALDAAKIHNCIAAWHQRQVMPTIQKNPAPDQPLPDAPEKSAYHEYRATLEKLRAIADPIEQSFEVLQYAKSVHSSPSRIEVDIKRLNPKTKQQEQTAFNLADFLAESDDSLDWQIPGLVPAGETILVAGAPKSGKTLLAVDAAYAVATGGKFLGEQVTKGRVLFISVDESPRSTRLKLRQRGFSGVEEVRVLTRLRIDNLGELEAQLADFQPSLTIIDSAKAICRSADIGENSAEFANAIYDLKELLGRYNSAALLIHHESKSKDADGINKVRGSSAITGACWGIWQLQQSRQTSEGDIEGDRWLKITARDCPGQSMKIAISPEDFSWHVTGQSAEQIQGKTQLDRIVSLLAQLSPAGLETDEISERLGIPIRALYPVLARGIDRKLLGKRSSAADPNRLIYFTSSQANKPANSLLTTANSSQDISGSGANNPANNAEAIKEALAAETIAETEFHSSANSLLTTPPLGRGNLLAPLPLAANKPANSLLTDSKTGSADHSLGNTVRYIGTDPRHQRVCQNKPLLITSVNPDSSLVVRNENWPKGHPGLTVAPSDVTPVSITGGFA